MSDQASVVELLRAMGCYVSVKSENRAARGTKGHPDLLVLHDKFPAPVAFEHKRKHEAATEAQDEFRRNWICSHGLYCRGGYDEAMNLLRAWGIVTSVVAD